MAMEHVTTEQTVTTPCGFYKGKVPAKTHEMCAVSIMRSGDILLEAMCRLQPGLPVGKILIQRDEADPKKTAKLFYSKLPHNISELKVFLVDPMLATGGSAILAVKVLQEAGVKDENLTFLNLISCPEGVAAFTKAHPKVHLLTCVIDEKLNEERFIVPGLGDMGDRYFQTL
mmetsp:Transcript_9949/g.18834  ORF Transcript_9949/g.18834 Transcript_9949/m.18834 type:complete len:172 (-) Transcript_9949:52-567(-)